MSVFHHYCSLLMSLESTALVVTVFTLVTFDSSSIIMDGLVQVSKIIDISDNKFGLRRNF